MAAWNQWYHLMANTYGTWPPGDPRGFRTRKHREHIEGDYKSPPLPGKYEREYRRAKRLMKRPPVFLSPPAREVVVEAIRYALVGVHALELLALAISSQHLHMLVRLPESLRRKPTLSKRGLRMSSVDDPARHYMGIAKKESSKQLAAEKLVAPGGVWAKRGKIVPIADRPHQVNVYHYILDHIREGAVTWSFREGIKKPTL